MPQGTTHNQFNLLLALPLALIILVFLGFMWGQILIFTLSFLYATLLFHPDLDVASKNRLFSIKGLLILPFYPYSYLFRHRGLSHNIFLSTLTRLLYLLFLGLLVLFFVNSVNRTNSISGTIYFLETVKQLALTPGYRDAVMMTFSAFVYADSCHIVLDKIF